MSSRFRTQPRCSRKFHHYHCDRKSIENQSYICRKSVANRSKIHWRGSENLSQIYWSSIPLYGKRISNDLEPCDVKYSHVLMSDVTLSTLWCIRNPKKPRLYTKSYCLEILSLIKPNAIANRPRFYRHSIETVMDSIECLSECYRNSIELVLFSFRSCIAILL